MSVLTSEAVVLRTWPVHEADLIVSFFTRDYGRMRGVAKAALKSRKRFGGALEPMTLARAWFAERPRQELVRLDQLEILRSPLSAPVDHTRMAVLSFYAELLDEVAARARSAGRRSSGCWFQCWSRLRPSSPMFRTAMDGADLFLPLDDPADGPAARHRPLHGMRRGIACERRSRFSSYTDGLFCGLHANGNASALSADSWQLAQRMLRAPVSAFAAEPWPRKRGQDLRRFTLQTLERHLERKLKSAEALARLGG